MFGKSNIDFRLDVHNERLNFLEGLVTRQEREIALLCGKSREWWQQDIRTYPLCSHSETLKAHDKLLEENKKLSREVESLKCRVELEKRRSAMLQRNIDILLSRAV